VRRRDGASPTPQVAGNSALPSHHVVACCFERKRKRLLRFVVLKSHQVDALCPAHRAVELLGIAGAFLVLEECVVGVVVDLVIVLFLNTGME
jgi:hypothetical protein